MSIFRKSKESPEQSQPEPVTEQQSPVAGENVESLQTIKSELSEQEKEESNEPIWDKETGIITNIRFLKGDYAAPTGGKQKTPSGLQWYMGWVSECEGKTLVLTGKHGAVRQKEKIDTNRTYNVRVRTEMSHATYVEIIE